MTVGEILASVPGLMATSTAAASALIPRTRHRVYRPGSIEQKVAQLRELELAAPSDAVDEYNFRLEMSWIHHDNALEGIVYDPQELSAAIHKGVISDSALLPAYDEIRRYREAIELVRQLAMKRRTSLTLDTVKQLYAVARSRPEVELCWIKSHNGYRWNEYADALASAYRRRTL